MLRVLWLAFLCEYTSEREGVRERERERKEEKTREAKIERKGEERVLKRDK